MDAPRAALSLVVLVLSASARGQTYTITDLGTLGGPLSIAYALNRDGDAAGTSSVDPTSGHAFLWDRPTGMVDLGTLGGSSSTALGLNSRGQVVGYSYTATNEMHAFVWQDGVMTDLSSILNGSSYSSAVGVNANRDIAGMYLPPSDSYTRGFLWRNGALVTFYAGAYETGIAGLNNLGQVVGTGRDMWTGKSFTMLWQPDGSGKDIAGIGTYPTAINDHTQVVINDSYGNAFLWDQGSLRDIGDLGGSVYAIGMNNQSQIVGVAYLSDGSPRAFLWSDGVMVDLNSRVVQGSYWTYLEPHAINDRGEVAGYGIHNGLGHAFLLTPIEHSPGEPPPKPETSTCWYVVAQQTDPDLLEAMYDLGEEEGRKASVDPTSERIIILTFGKPWWYRDIYGAKSWWAGGSRFLRVTTIETATEHFCLGYWHGLGSRPKPQLRIAIGTNSYGPGEDQPPTHDRKELAFNHGQAWAQMVNRFGDWLSRWRLDGYIRPAGACDIEWDPRALKDVWVEPDVAYAWVNGYTSAASYWMFNFGAAPGCPESGTSATPGNCTNNRTQNWTQEHVWFVSWGAYPCLPLPEIYNTLGRNAEQWQQISLYSCLAHTARMNIVGALSQAQACKQRPPCGGTNNTPDQAWEQLWKALNANWRTAQGLIYSADMKWTQ